MIRLFILETYSHGTNRVHTHKQGLEAITYRLAIQYGTPPIQLNSSELELGMNQ